MPRVTLCLGCERDFVEPFVICEICGYDHSNVDQFDHYEENDDEEPSAKDLKLYNEHFDIYQTQLRKIQYYMRQRGEQLTLDECEAMLARHGYSWTKWRWWYIDSIKDRTAGSERALTHKKCRVKRFDEFQDWFAEVRGVCPTCGQRKRHPNYFNKKKKICLKCCKVKTLQINLLERRILAQHRTCPLCNKIRNGIDKWKIVTPLGVAENKGLWSEYLKRDNKMLICRQCWARWKNANRLENASL